MRPVLLAPLLAVFFASTASAQQYYDGAASRALCRGSIEDCRREARERRERSNAQPTANLNGANQYVAPQYGLTLPQAATSSTPAYAPTQPAYTSPSAAYAAPTAPAVSSYTSAGQAAPSNTELAQRIEALDGQMNDIKAMLARMEAQLGRR